MLQRPKSHAYVGLKLYALPLNTIATKDKDDQAVSDELVTAHEELQRVLTDSRCRNEALSRHVSEEYRSTTKSSAYITPSRKILSRHSRQRRPTTDRRHNVTRKH